MRKHREHCLDDSRGFVVTVSIFMQLFMACLSDYYKKNFLPNSGPNFGGASYKCNLHLNKSGKQIFLIVLLRT